MQDLDRRGLATLASGHAAADLCQGSIPALIPFLVHQRGYSFGAAGVLLLVVTIGSSIIQPVFGALSDRLQLAWLMPVGVALAAVGIAGAGLFDSFALTCIVVGLGGLGVAAFHPEGARYANYASGDRRGTGMSLFSVGGNAGFALAPVLITPAVLLVGLSGTLIVAILPAIVAVVLAVELPKMKRRSAAAAKANAAGKSDRSDDQWGAFGTLAGVVSIRSGVYFGLQSFAALWLIHTYGVSEASGNVALAGMLFAGALGTLVGGRLVDRIGRRRVLIGSIVAQIPLLLGVHARAGRHPRRRPARRDRLRDRDVVQRERGDGAGVPAEPARDRVGRDARVLDRRRRRVRGAVRHRRRPGRAGDRDVDRRRAAAGRPGARAHPAATGQEARIRGLEPAATARTGR